MWLSEIDLYRHFVHSYRNLGNGNLLLRMKREPHVSSPLGMCTRKITKYFNWDEGSREVVFRTVSHSILMVQI